MCKFSVIVPVYRVETMLPRCIESILNQTVTDFELILVDDGSPDRSGEICDEYAARDSRICVIHQENGGVSRARNAGLDVARGEYIVFVDSDDWVDSNYLESLDSTDADLVIAGYQIEGYGVENSVVRQYENCAHSVSSVEEQIVLFETGMLNYVWTKAFKAKVVQENFVRFNKKLNLAEDTLFVVQFIAFCRTVKQISAIGYHYIKYPHQTLSSGDLFSTSTVLKIEDANTKIYSEVKENWGMRAKTAIGRRIFPVYRNLLAECIDNEKCSWQYVYSLFRSYWFREALNHVDAFCTNESPKYRFILKTKSAVLFWLFVKHQHFRKRKGRDRI